MPALVAIAAYFPRQPAGFSFGGSCHFVRRSASSASGTSRSSCAPGCQPDPVPQVHQGDRPSAAASGETCPMTAPRVPAGEAPVGDHRHLVPEPFPMM